MATINAWNHFRRQGYTKDKNSDYAIIELNFNSAIHIHSYPYVGKEREIAKEILKLLNFI